MTLHRLCLYGVLTFSSLLHIHFLHAHSRENYIIHSSSYIVSAQEHNVHIILFLYLEQNLTVEAETNTVHTDCCARAGTCVYMHVHVCAHDKSVGMKPSKNITQCYSLSDIVITPDSPDRCCEVASTEMV